MSFAEVRGLWQAFPVPGISTTGETLVPSFLGLLACSPVPALPVPTSGGRHSNLIVEPFRATRVPITVWMRSPSSSSSLSAGRNPESTLDFICHFGHDRGFQSTASFFSQRQPIERIACQTKWPFEAVYNWNIQMTQRRTHDVLMTKSLSLSPTPTTESRIFEVAEEVQASLPNWFENQDHVVFRIVRFLPQQHAAICQ